MVGIINKPLISVVILNYNGEQFLDDCLSSVFKTRYPNFEVILVDNASTDRSLQNAIEKFNNDARFKVIKNEKNLLFTGGNNVGIKATRGRYIIILNNDTLVHPEWLSEITNVMENDRNIGAAQPKILSFPENDRIDSAGSLIDRYGYAKARGYQQIDIGQYDKIEEIFYATGTALILRKDILEEVGLFDTDFGAHWEDVDLCWRIRLRGYSIVFIPKAIVYHKGSKSMSQFVSKPEVAWYIRKNRIAGIIKSYNFFNLLQFLPFVILFYILISVKELLFDKNKKLAFSSWLALFWNIKELPHTLSKRKFVQNKIRRVSDNVILKYMYGKSVLLMDYLLAFINKN